MKLTIISGSHRKNSQSAKVGRYIESVLRSEKLCDEVFFLDLSGFPFPLWDESIWEDDPDWKARTAPYAEQLRSSDGFVVISPEWHGMVPSGLKNFFLIFGRNELAHRPALIVTVSNARGGAFPVAELRMSSYKNSRICYIPEQVIVRHVESVLNEDGENDAKSDTYYRDRIPWALRILREYALALRQVRASGATDMSVHRTGMS